MFETLEPQPTDKIMALMNLFSQDERENKLDLGVGVYKDQRGVTPVMNAVKQAEKIILDRQTTKKYVGLIGSLGFVQEMIKLTLGDSTDRDRICGVQTPGGTGALHQLFLLTRKARPDLTVWVPAPTWPNHPAILRHLKIKTANYTYFDETNCSVNFSDMITDIKQARTGDVLLLHGCCHNPTGANLTSAQWNEITELCLYKKMTPLIDIAYQGFGDGLDQDVVGLRMMAHKIPEMMIASSCSKNFGVYRERVGVAIVIAKSRKEATMAEENLKSLNRLTYSFPPDHGAAVVEEILTSKDLLYNWCEELENMRKNMLELRSGLASCLRKHTNSERFDFIANHRGMFSRLGLTEKNVKKLREDFGIYMVSDSRINVAGLQENRLDFLASSISKVIM